MKHKDIIVLLTSAFLLVIAWVAFSVYHNSVTSNISETLEKEALPINPKFDEATINKLKERKKILPMYELSAPIISPTIKPSPTPNEENLTGTASEGGEIIP